MNRIFRRKRDRASGWLVRAIARRRDLAFPTGVSFYTLNQDAASTDTAYSAVSVALGLIARTAPIYLRWMQRARVDFLVLIDAKNIAAYNPHSRFILLSPTFGLRHDTAGCAMMLVHEIAHARVAHSIADLAYRSRHRTESVARKMQYEFIRTVAPKHQLIEWAAREAAISEDASFPAEWSQRQRTFRRLRSHGCPARAARTLVRLVPNDVSGAQ